MAAPLGFRQRNDLEMHSIVHRRRSVALKSGACVLKNEFSLIREIKWLEMGDGTPHRINNNKKSKTVSFLLRLGLRCFAKGVSKTTNFAFLEQRARVITGANQGRQNADRVLTTILNSFKSTMTQKWQRGNTITHTQRNKDASSTPRCTLTRQLRSARALRR